LNVAVSEVLADVLRAEGFDAQSKPSARYFEVVTGPDKPLTEAHAERAQRVLADKGYFAKILGVSGIASGYRAWGVVFESQSELEAYRAEIAVRLGHKTLADQMGLCVFNENAPGSVFWLDRGVELRKRLQEYLSSVVLRRAGQFVETPTIMKEGLWKCSGHIPTFADNMYFTNDEQALKPMNCPAHMLMFGATTRSYRDLPMRIYEYGRVHRYEASGALQGLLRLRSFTQDDGHVFTTIDQIKSEVQDFIDDTKAVYGALGFERVTAYLATRPAECVGDDAEWESAEAALRSLGLPELPGEGAFYGPKIEMHLEDAMGRTWQCGTIQLDFILPKRMNLRYVAPGGEEVVPVVLHRAILGSLERFIAILLENTQGWLPFWLAPVQIALVPVGTTHRKRAEILYAQLQKHGVRALIAQDQSLGKNLRQHREERVTKAWILGDREVDCVTERNLRTGECVTLNDADAIKSAVCLSALPVYRQIEQ
jgi:threonyl-tRNA synthetase